MQPATARDLRRTNRSVILRELLFSGETSRQALAGTTGLSPATVGLVIADLMDEGLVVETGTEGPSVGRPRMLLRIVPDRWIVIGADLGERGVRMEAVDLAWERRAEVMVAADPARQPPAEVVAAVAEALQDLLAEHGIDQDRVLGMGVTVPGIVDRGTDSLVQTVAFGWHDVPLGRMFRSAIGLPIVVDNGAKALGQAEMWFGAGRGAQDAVVTLLGIGVGAAVFMGGRLYRGSQSSAGEWGHVPIVVEGDACRCGSWGCLEAYVGESAILRRWTATDPAADTTDGPDTLRLERLFAADTAAAASVREAVATYLGAGLAGLINLFDPERIVLAGSVGLRLTPEMLDRVRERAGRYALRRPFESVEITQGRLGDDAVALGAATLIVEDMLASGFQLPLPVVAAALPAGAAR